MSRLKSKRDKLPAIIRRFAVGATLVVGAVAVGAILWMVLKGGGGPRIGYGDTVIRYAHRTYESAGWQELREAATLSSLAKNGKGDRIGALKRITGLDRDNFWIVDAMGNMFRRKDGHWRYERAIAGGMKALTARVTANGGVIVGGWPSDRGLAIWQEDRTRTFETARGGVLKSGHIHILADDYVHFFTVAGAANAGTYAFRLVSDRMQHVTPEIDLTFFVHSANNVPNKGISLPHIIATATFASPTEAYGFWKFRDKGAVLRFLNGTWVLIDEIERGVAPVRSVRFGEDDEGTFIIAAGSGGHVLIHPFGAQTIVQSVNADPKAPTNTDLIAVWGVDRRNFWVMDSSGTIWQRADNHTWAVVIRGLYDADVHFIDAYVAPDGAVHAITKNSVYLLD